MAAGYGFGPMLLGEPGERQKKLIRLGILLSAVFLVIRAINFYGDPRPWAVQNSALFTAFSFVNCTKYPPSFLFLLMTLGPAIIALGLLDRALMDPLSLSGEKVGAKHIELQNTVLAPIPGEGAHGAIENVQLSICNLQLPGAPRAQAHQEARSKRSSDMHQRFHTKATALARPLIIFAASLSFIICSTCH